MQDDNDKKTAVTVMSKADAFAQAGKTAVLQNIQGTLQFLQRFPPFNQMENAHLAFLVEQYRHRRWLLQGGTRRSPQAVLLRGSKDYVELQGRQKRYHSRRRGQ